MADPKRKSSGKLRRLIAWGIVAGVLGVMGWVGVSAFMASGDQTNGQAAAGTDPERVRVVDVAEVVEIGLERTVSATGSLASYEPVTVRSQVPGRVERVYADLGDLVEPGQELLRLERRDYEIQLREAAARLAQSRSRLGLREGQDADEVDLEQLAEVRRARSRLRNARWHYEQRVELRARASISDSEFEDAEMMLELAESEHAAALNDARQRLAELDERIAAVEKAQRDLDETVILSPSRGAVEQRMVNPGQHVDDRDPVFAIVQMDPLRLVLEVPERRAAQVRLGQPIRFRVENDPTVYQARIQRLSPVIDRLRRVLLIEADVENSAGTLRPGSFVRGEVVIEASSPGLVLPSEAVFSFAGVDRAYIVEDDGTVRDRIITVVQRNERWAEVRDLSAGQIVVMNPGNLRRGTRVEVRNRVKIEDPNSAERVASSPQPASSAPLASSPPL